MTALAYIRRSTSSESKVSEDTQREAVARLAAEHGQAIERVYRDWGRSGGDEERPEYLAMLDRLERGGVDAVLAFDQDRLARNAWMFTGLLRLAKRHRFKVITTAGELSDKRMRVMAIVKGALDEAELDLDTERAMRIDARQRERGDDRGMAPFGYDWLPRQKKSDERVVIACVDPDGIRHVVETYERVGSYVGTARALNAEGFPSKRGKTWHPVVVRDLIAREAPDLVVGITQGRRARTSRPRLFRGLLRCWCDGFMTPASGGKGTDMYYCGAGSLRGLHGKPHYISEAKLLPSIRDEVARYLEARSVIVAGDPYDDSEDRRTLAAMRERIGEEAYRAGIAALDATRAAHGARIERIEELPDSIDWEHDPVAEVNGVLRAIFEAVHLGEDLLPRPDGFDAKVPGWRSA